MAFAAARVVLLPFAIFKGESTPRSLDHLSGRPLPMVHFVNTVIVTLQDSAFKECRCVPMELSMISPAHLIGHSGTTLGHSGASCPIAVTRMLLNSLLAMHTAQMRVERG